MVVDDEEDIARMLGEMLRRLGYASVVCDRPENALKLFLNTPERFDAVIVDEMMPVLKGTQLTRQLLRIKDDIPVILLTGHGDMISVDEARESGVRITLTKPVEKAILGEALAGLLK
ncbi:MAG TPA: response regulator [Syntrophorhabdaceae bacterium]|jgi:DNA-binding response OmpR family regulator